MKGSLKLVDGEIVGRLVIKFNILSSSHKKGSFRLLVCPANPVIRSKYPFFYGVTPPFSTTVKKLRTKAAKREALLEELSSVDAEGLAATNPRAQKRARHASGCTHKGDAAYALLQQRCVALHIVSKPQWLLLPFPASLGGPFRRTHVSRDGLRCTTLLARRLSAIADGCPDAQCEPGRRSTSGSGTDR